MSEINSSAGLNVFAGEHSLLDFLDPGKAPPTPMVELPPELNPYRDRCIRVFLKLQYMTPIFNGKLLASRSLFEEAQAEGRLDGVHTLVENSSGNKIFADIFLARLFGIKNVIASVPRDIPPDKQTVLELFGATCDKTAGGIERCRKLGRQAGWWNPAQYHEDANVRGSERWLGPQILEQTCGEITLLCAGIGTGGTIKGARDYLSVQVPMRTIGVVPATDEVPGTRTLRRLEEVGIEWRSALDDGPVVVEALEAYFHSLRLCSRGILAGPSSGMALAGLFKYLERLVGDFSGLWNDNGEVVAVVPCPDSCMLYLDKYSTRLLPEDMEAAIA